MASLFSLVENSKKLKINKLLQVALNDKRVQQFIISLNTHDQLFDLGENSKGVKLIDIGGAYSINTIEGVPGVYEGKRALGLPTDRVTLFHTGKFYSTFRVHVGARFFDIIANTKKDDDDLVDEWGINILGLNEENTGKLIELLQSIIRPNILEILLS